MPAVVVVGAQWGDEGKGKIVDLLAEEADMVVRFNGGANAGHTLVVDGKKYITHILPSGIVRRGQRNLVGPGVVVDLEATRDELEIANLRGSLVWLDRSAPLVHPLHKLLDRSSEQGSDSLGTTGRGIGPAYADLAARCSVKLGDLTSSDKVRRALTARGSYDDKRMILERRFAALAEEARPQIPSLDELVEWCLSFASMVKPRLCDSRAIVSQALDLGRHVLFEGAQGVMLDVIQGSQPFTTASSCTVGCVSTTFGVYDFSRVIGITKAYATRVGGGPFPTKLENATGNRLRELGGEFGATTGRPRGCGWLDLPALRYAVRTGGITELFMTKLDVLELLGEFEVCTKYRFEDRLIDKHDTLTTYVLEHAQIVTRAMKAGESIASCQAMSDVPAWVASYLHLIQSATGVPVTGIGTGPDRQNILLRGI